MLINTIIDATEDELESAKLNAVALSQDNINQKSLVNLFYSENLNEVENGIKLLNEYSEKSWLLSALLLYTMVYNKDLYRQSGLEWTEYIRKSRARLGMEARDVSEQLSAARFYIKHHKALIKYNWSPVGSRRKLSTAELALRLSNNLEQTLQHLAADTWQDFKLWYYSFKIQKALPKATENRRTDISYSKNKYKIGDIEAVTISKDLSKSDNERLNKYIKQIFTALENGYEPAIIEVYDTKEASVLTRLRDKYRQGK